MFFPVVSPFTCVCPVCLRVCCLVWSPVFPHTCLFTTTLAFHRPISLHRIKDWLDSARSFSLPRVNPCYGQPLWGQLLRPNPVFFLLAYHVRASLAILFTFWTLSHDQPCTSLDTPPHHTPTASLSRNSTFFQLFHWSPGLCLHFHIRVLQIWRFLCFLSFD